MRHSSSRLQRSLQTIGILTAFTLAAAGCPEAKKKHEEITDEVGHAPKKQLEQVETRLNNAAHQASDRLKAAAANADKATAGDEGGW